ncbi:unnamed protein product [Rhizophagus irregularis]|nr:unnamed protein product [Rhizophagus irregularis]
MLTAKGVNGGRIIGGKIFDAVDDNKCGCKGGEAKIIDGGGLVASNKGEGEGKFIGSLGIGECSITSSLGISSFCSDS